MDKLFIVGVILVAMAVSVPFVMGPPVAGDDYCCQGIGCPICNPFIPPDDPPPDDFIGPPSPPSGFWEKFGQMLDEWHEGDNFSNDMFWWLRK